METLEKIVEIEPAIEKGFTSPASIAAHLGLPVGMVAGRLLELELNSRVVRVTNNVFKLNDKKEWYVVEDKEDGEPYSTKTPGKDTIVSGPHTNREIEHALYREVSLRGQ